MLDILICLLIIVGVLKVMFKIFDIMFAPKDAVDSTDVKLNYDDLFK